MMDTSRLGPAAFLRWTVALGATCLLLGMAPGSTAQEAATAGAPDPSPHSEVQLVSSVTSIRPGEPFHAAIHVTLDEGWHTYWLNAGDAGLPLIIDWRLPEGFEAGALKWPAPHIIPVPPLASYGFEGQLLLPVEITPPPTLEPGRMARLFGTAEFLVCADVCLPATGEVALDLLVRDASSPPGPNWGAAIADVLDRLPAATGEWATRAWTTDAGYVVELVGAAASDLPAPYLFVDSMSVVQHAAPQQVARSGDTVRIVVPRNEYASGDVNGLRGVLVANVDAGSPSGWWIEADVGPAPARVQPLPGAAQSTGGIEMAGTNEAVSPAEPGSVGTANRGGGELGLALALLFAFAGGLILNLMPCVFPVLSVKVLGFVEHAGGRSAKARKHGLLFGAGVLVSFWILAGALLGLRAGGESLGWGFQLQSPGIVAALAILLFGLGLNLSGVFEVGLGMTRLGGVGADRGYLDSFLTGGLTTIVATPCTAPFMGAALGFALVQPPVVGFGVFTALALGLAAPYVLLSFAPGLLKRLPAPGAWMETVRQALAFPLYATVVWLVWVFGRQAGIDATGVLLLGLTLLALAAWLYDRGRVPRNAETTASRGLRMAAVLALIAGGALAVQGTLLADPPARGADRTSTDGEAEGLAWEEFSPERVDELRRDGQPVFIDFTAAWCLSCQVNERVALGTQSVRDAFDEGDVALLEADWTNRDPVIARTIESFGRSGVPLYVLYPAGPGEAEILPAVLTPGIVVEAVRRAAE